ncbi:hypothetical protein [Fictibacillus nanhaiensis]
MKKLVLKTLILSFSLALLVNTTTNIPFGIEEPPDPIIAQR